MYPGLGWAFCRAKKFHSMCTQTAHTPIFVNFDENGRNFWEKNTPKMCLLGAHTDTPFWGPKPPPIPQNISKFHALTIICRKDTACSKNVTEIGSTFFKCMKAKFDIFLQPTPCDVICEQFQRDKTSYEFSFQNNVSLEIKFFSKDSKE